MKTIYMFCLVILLFSLAMMRSSDTSAQQKSPAPARTGDVNRGKYLVEEVAKCAECHTPRDAQGQLDTTRWLQGAPIWIMPVQPIYNWGYRAPALAGFPAYSDRDGENILEKGRGPRGEVLRPPMHVYHMSHEDATAIIAYLRSLPASPQ